SRRRHTRCLSDWSSDVCSSDLFSELFGRARSEGPQLITRRDKEGVVMISDEQYQRLVGKAHQPQNLLQFFRESPLVGIELDLERSEERRVGKEGRVWWWSGSGS